MNQARFHDLLAPVTQWLAGRHISPALTESLNSEFPSDSEWFAEIKELCSIGLNAGWLCQYEAGGIKYGRVFKPNDDLSGFSVDVVLMKDVVGPHHSHPNGEVDLVIPLNEGAAFDGIDKGWKVYSPESAHKPTVTGGEAFVIYLLPDGAIEFTR